MSSTRSAVFVALALGAAVACNALLDNDPRELAYDTALGGRGGEGGEINGTSGTSDGGAAVTVFGGAPNAAGEGGGPSPTCTDCALGQAESECRDGACAITACHPGFLDKNRKPDDGCEAGDVPADSLLLWFMADHGVSVMGEGVEEWTNQSAAHVTAAAMSTEAMPRLVRPASGPPLVEFDGADDGLELPEGFSTFNGATFFAVAQAYAAEGCAGILSLSNGGDSDDIEFGRHTKNILYYEVLGDFVEGAERAFEASQRLIVSITQSATGAVELRINGVLNASPTTIPLPKSLVRKQNFVGRDTYTECPQGYKGLLGELILFNRGVSTAEYRRIQAYLSAKWGVAVTPL